MLKLPLTTVLKQSLVQIICKRYDGRLCDVEKTFPIRIWTWNKGSFTNYVGKILAFLQISFLMPKLEIRSQIWWIDTNFIWKKMGDKLLVTNYNSCKIECFHSFFGGNVCLRKSFRFCLIFTYHLPHNVCLIKIRNNYYRSGT